LQRPVSPSRAGLSLFVVAVLAGCAPDRPVPVAPAPPPDDTAVARGAVLAAAANCAGCHTDATHGGARFAGGKAIETPFGAYYSRNITPDPEHGIGRWSDGDFLRALREGLSPSGAHYFAAFPFAAFTGMTDRDILDIFAYLRSQPPAPTANRAHDVGFPFDVRLSMVLWRALYFTEGPLAQDPAHDAEWNRGAYLANAVAHCGECHTPRTALGGLDATRRFAGARLAGPDPKTVPDITPQRGDGIASWSLDDIARVLKDGTTPIGDTVAAPMSEVVEGTAQLSDADRRAIAVYLKALPALPSAVPSPAR
jgi:mono/diheme cytochrome c family protein